MLRKELIKETHKPKSNPARTVSTVKPGTMFAAKRIKDRLIISENKPRVKIFIGNVSMVITGFRKVFSTPKTTATIKAVVRSIISTP